MQKSLNGGFIGLLVLLICVAFIALFIMRTDLFTGKEGANMLDEGQNAIDDARALKVTLEKNSQPLPE